MLMLLLLLQVIVEATETKTTASALSALWVITHAHNHKYAVSVVPSEDVLACMFLQRFLSHASTTVSGFGLFSSLQPHLLETIADILMFLNVFCQERTL